MKTCLLLTLSVLALCPATPALVDLDPTNPGCSVSVTVSQKKKWSETEKQRKNVRLYLDPLEDCSFTGAVALERSGATDAPASSSRQTGLLALYVVYG